METIQYRMFKKQLENVYRNNDFFKEKMQQAGLTLEEIKGPKDISNIPFTTKEELRDIYPLGLLSVPSSRIVRVHSSSGTTGKPVIIPYTQKDVEVWMELMGRCMKLAGVTMLDRVQVTAGYGLWTAGIGFQAGIEHLGAMAIPAGAGNTSKQLMLMEDLKTTAFVATSSYALVLAEEAQRLGIADKLHLKKAIVGSERWGNKMRERIANTLGIQLYDIYGLTEIYGPGIAIECDQQCGMHYFDDHLYFEIIDPSTLQPLPEGEVGELVITTLTKEGAPIIRYRTRDLTRIIPGECKCGSKYPRIDRIIGRSDDMIKIKGVNIYPGQIEDILKEVEEVSSEYQICIDHIDGRDKMLIRNEVKQMRNLDECRQKIEKLFKRKVGIKIQVELVREGTLPRSEKKSKRVFDYRENE